jgi:uncharacterized membrane protein YraQ (UPF0718 family)/copper chaperone CopZ
METELLLKFLTNIWYTTEALSFWLLVGIIIAGIMHIWVPDNFIIKHLGDKRGALSVFKAVLLGVPMPLCSCGVIPAAVGIKKQGAGDGAAVGFMISTPQTGIDSLMVSASLLGLPFALFKVGSAFVIGIIGGLWIYYTGRSTGAEALPGRSKDRGGNRGLKDFFPFAVDDLLKMIWKWLAAGIIVSAALTTFLPENFFREYLPENIFISMLIVLLVSLPMYVCATASVPIAAALVYAGMPTGAALVFLMAGPASNIATAGAVYRAFGIKNLIIYLLVIIAGSMVGGYLFDSVIDTGAVRNSVLNHSGGGIAETVSAVILCFLIGRFIIIELLEKFRYAGKPNEHNCCKKCSDSEMRTFRVSGMSCEGCSTHLKNKLMELKNITDVKIILDRGIVEVEGRNIDYKKIEKIIEDCGYVNVV